MHFRIQKDEEITDPQIETTDLTTTKIKSVKQTLYAIETTDLTTTKIKSVKQTLYAHLS